MFGHSDDNWVLAPSLSALQDILKTCEEYAAFLSKQRYLPSMYMCGNPLPWVNNLKHLGTRITNQLDGCQLDMKQKIARYIDRNCSLNQEFYFAHPMTKIKVKVKLEEYSSVD